MPFKLIDIENWESRELYEHFIGEVVCTYSAADDKFGVRRYFLKNLTVNKNLQEVIYA